MSDSYFLKSARASGEQRRVKSFSPLSIMNWRWVERFHAGVGLPPVKDTIDP